MPKCQRCGGSPRGIAFVNTGMDSRKHYMTDTTCDQCDGTGEWSDDRLAAWKVGQAWEERRRATGELIIESAERMGIRLSDVCKIRDGRLPIPDDSPY